MLTRKHREEALAENTATQADLKRRFNVIADHDFESR